MLRALLVFSCAALLTAVAGAGELNLWISYYYPGVEDHAAGHYFDAAALLEDARAEATSGEAHRLAATLDRAGAAEIALEDYEAGEKYLKCALRLKQDELGPRSMELPETLTRLGDLYYVVGQAQDAEEQYRAALDLLEDDQLNIEVSRALNGLALIHHQRGEEVQSEALLRRAVDQHERQMRRWHPYLATALTNLAILYTHQRRLDEAEPLLDRARFIQEQALPSRHPDVALRLRARAFWLQASGQEAAALQAEREAASMREEFERINGVETRR